VPMRSQRKTKPGKISRARSKIALGIGDAAISP
jgi:hypothetical protein